MDSTNVPETGGTARDTLKVSLQKVKVPAPTGIIAGMLSTAVAFGLFILLMAVLGGVFILLAWPLHSWLGLGWLPAFGVVVALFFAAGASVAYFQIWQILHGIREAANAGMDNTDTLTGYCEEIGERDAERKANLDDDSEDDAAADSRANSIPF